MSDCRLHVPITRRRWLSSRPGSSFLKGSDLVSSSVKHLESTFYHLSGISIGPFMLCIGKMASGTICMSKQKTTGAVHCSRALE